jgi:cytochrome c-type biogenesis protein CcmH/NrfG
MSCAALSIVSGTIVLALPLVVLDGPVSPYFDPKAWVLHLLVAAGATAWLFERRREAHDRRNGSSADVASRVLKWVVLAYGGWWVVTILTSITLGTSVWGNFGRADGLLTRLATITLFFLVQAQFRSPAVAGSFVDLALLGSIPVVLLGLGQAMGWDSLPQVGDPATLKLRVRSTLGQHVFLGSYLVLMIPLAAARFAGFAAAPSDAHPRAPVGGSERRAAGEPQPRFPGRARRAADEPEPQLERVTMAPLVVGGAWVIGALALVALGAWRPSAWWGLLPWAIVGAGAWTRWAQPDGAALPGGAKVVVLGAILLGQILTVVVSGARAAFVGMLVGLSVAGCALAVSRRAWRRLAVGAGALGIVLVILLVVNLRDSPLSRLISKAPAPVQRFGRLADVDQSSARFRVNLWKGILSGWVRQARGEELIPGGRIRSVIGYGPESQLATLYRLTARPDPAGGRFLRDRAHNEVLDDLVTGGLVGATLWLAVMGAVLFVGVRRLRTSAPGAEAGIRVGCLGAVAGHLVDAQFGIATPVSTGLFWIVAALLTAPLALDDRAPPDRVDAGTAGRRGRWLALLIVASILAAAVAWGSTRWLAASMAYARGSRLLNAGAESAAQREFQEASRLVPGLSQPAEANAGVAVALAGGERDPRRQLVLLTEAEAALAAVRRYSSYATTGPYHWVLVGQVALAQYRAGDPSKLATALEAYETAARLQPGDSWILANWGVAWLDARNPERAREVAEHAVARKPDNWLAWAVLARAASQLGDATRTEQATASARALAPPEAHSLLGELLGPSDERLRSSEPPRGQD